MLDWLPVARAAPVRMLAWPSDASLTDALWLARIAGATTVRAAVSFDAALTAAWLRIVV